MSNDVMDRIAVRKKNEAASNSNENWQDWPPEIDLAASSANADCALPSSIIRAAKFRVTCGDGRALVAVACRAIVLEAHIVAGSLVPSALNQLREVADNLGTTKRCGADVVDTCIGVGAALFAELEDVYARRDDRVAA